MDQDLKLSADLGMLRLGLAVPDLKLADVPANVESLKDMIASAGAAGVQVLVFPEMALTGYTLGDLVQQEALLRGAERGLGQILEASREFHMLILVGLPLAREQRVYNCAAALNAGRLLGVIPKINLPNQKEFYNGRWFAPGDAAAAETISLLGQEVPFGADLLFTLRDMPWAVIGAEICEDLWMPLAPHAAQALSGATLLLNLSASNEIVGKADWRRTMVASESGRCVAAYGYVSSGRGESSNDIVFGGHALVAENGIIVRESTRLAREAQLILADLDLERLVHDRRISMSFQHNAENAPGARLVETTVADPPAEPLHREVDAHPFVPADPARRAERCRDIFAMQVAALAQRLTATQPRIIMGVSGGLDSTLALLVAAKTADFLGLPRTEIYAFTMPGFGTTRRTKSNATRLCQALGVTFQRRSIVRSCAAHLSDLEHNGVEDVVFENVQARYRTAFLFNKANELGGLVLGTGDLTEEALGWDTFAGDHLSHYHINTSVPKTLVQYLIRWVADEELARTPAARLLYDILDTPISPELKRPQNGEITQKSEDVTGPMELADFFLYPFIRYGMRPGKILFLADVARRRNLFTGQYSREDLYRWLDSFIRRFFANQFKRTCLPEGPKIGSVSLSPRGDWRMPSDAHPRLWLDDLETTYRRLKGSPGKKKG